MNEVHRDEAVPFSSDEHRVERAKETRRRREKKKGGGFKLGIEGEESWSSFEKKGVLKGGRKERREEGKGWNFLKTLTLHPAAKKRGEESRLPPPIFTHFLFPISQRGASSSSSSSSRSRRSA